MTATDGGRRRFSRRQRLLKGAQFEHVFAAPHRSSDRFFTVLTRENGMKYARLGLAVGKKRLRLAVARNRVKRLVRESFRHHAERLHGLDVVVLARFDGMPAGRDLLRSLDGHWDRLLGNGPERVLNPSSS